VPKNAAILIRQGTLCRECGQSIITGIYQIVFTGHVRPANKATALAGRGWVLREPPPSRQERLQLTGYKMGMGGAAYSCVTAR
jgi:hypothetical protein